MALKRCDTQIRRITVKELLLKNNIKGAIGRIKCFDEPHVDPIVIDAGTKMISGFDRLKNLIKNGSKDTVCIQIVSKRSGGLGCMSKF